MFRMWNTVVRTMAAGVLLLGGSPARAADPANPDWPCVQRKMATLTAAQMWDGGEVEGLTQWRDDAAIARLIAVLASRRVPLDQAADAIVAFADSRPEDRRDDALRELFAGLLDAVNRDRAVVMSGIERFNVRQRARAAEIERQSAALRALEQRAGADETARAELDAARERYDWDVRVFTERQQSLPLACEVPVLIEQRLFALAREIRAQMRD
jgi:hypothetical protein